MRRFYIESIDVEGGLARITGNEARHISKVLRMGTGERLVLMDGRGRRFQTVIRSTKAREVEVVIEKTLKKPPPSPVEIILCQSVLKSRAMDYLLQKTSELGVDCIFPFFSERTVIRLRPDKVASKLRHWKEIARNSAKQCDRDVPVNIIPPLTLGDLLGRVQDQNALKVIFWEKEEKAFDLRRLLKGSDQRDQFIGIVGPEGGFAEREVRLASRAGFVPATLGRRILRAETAAITLTAIVQYEWGDLCTAGQDES